MYSFEGPRNKMKKKKKPQNFHEKLKDEMQSERLNFEWIKCRG